MRCSRHVILLIFILAAVSLCAANSVEIRVEQANARIQPDSTATISAVLNKGEVYPVVDDVPYWYQLKLSDGREVWVAKSLCTLIVETDEDTEETNANAQPSGELYGVPAAGAAVTIQNCTPSSLTVNWNVCSDEGSGSSGGQAKYWRTNQKKNRIQISCTYSQLTMAEMLAFKSLPWDVRKLDATDLRATYLQSLESRAIVLEGYLAMVKKAEEESTNCYSDTRKDIHIELVATDQGDPKSLRHEVVVTEVSPWFGETIAAWTASNLGQYASYRNGYGGNMQRPPGHVKIYGWLFYDDPHSKDASVGTWRGTAWELHPITRIEVFENGSWKEIQ